MKQIFKIQLLLVLCAYAAWTSDTVKDSQGDPPRVSMAKDSVNDPFYPYIKRPRLSASKVIARLGKDLPKNIKARITTDVNHLPWTLSDPKKLKKGRFKLSDVVVDKIKDPQSGKNYIKLYHGTTSDLADIFSEGAKIIRFDAADRTALGNGFYLTADPNEAKSFACSRRRLREKDEKDLKGLLLVVGVLDDERIQGKTAAPKSSTDIYSDDQGDPLNENIYFARNQESHNQFLFFSNIAPYLKIFEVVALPDGFGKAKTFRDQDGLPVSSTIPEKDKSLRCVF